VAALSRCLRTHRAALERAGVDVEALVQRQGEIRRTDGGPHRVAAMTAVEELLDEAEAARAETAAEIERRGGRASALELVPRGAAAPAPGAPAEPEVPRGAPAPPPAPEAAPAPPTPDRTAAARERYTRERQVDPGADDILAAIAKAGGWNRAEAEAQGIDPAHFGARGWRILPVFKKAGGLTADGLAEHLAQHGYPVLDAKGAYNANELLDAVDRALRGERVLSTRGAERAGETRLEAEEAWPGPEGREILDERDPFDDVAPGEMLGEGEYTEDQDLTSRRMQELIEELEGLEEGAGEAVAERAAIRELDDADTIALLEEAVRERRAQQGGPQREAAEGARPPAEVGPRARGPEGDLFGEDTRTAQGLADRAREVEGRLSGAGREVPPDVEGGLFGPGSTQADIEDVAGAKRQSAIERTTPDETDLPEGPAAMVAHHGTPHEFERFSTEAIGTGEGAQAFGWGLYFAEARETAEGYRARLSADPVHQIEIDGELVDAPGWDPSLPPRERVIRLIVEEVANTGSSTQAAAGALESRLEAERASPYIGPELAEQIRVLRVLRPRLGEVRVTEPGHVYRVDVADEAVSHFLDWDRPLAEQPRRVQLAARDVLREVFGADNWRARFDDMDGQRFYEEVSRQRRGQRQASEFLAERGIKGVRYLDRLSRAAGEGTRNLVVFDDSLVTVLDRDGKPLESERQEELLLATHGGARAGPHNAPMIGNQGRTPAPARPRAERDKPIRRDDVIFPFVQALGVPLHTGRMKKARALGYYIAKQETVRIKHMSDLEVVAHELAHLIDDRNPELRATWRKNRALAAELKSVSYDTKKVYEGFAEWIRLWMSQPEVLDQHTPLYLEYWRGWLKDHPDKQFVHAIYRAREGMLAWWRQDAVTRLESKHGADDSRVREALVTVSGQFRQSIVDDLDGILRMEIGLRGGRTGGALGPYETARLAKAAYAIVDGALRHGAPVVQPDGSHRFEGPGLVEILDPVRGDVEDFTNYAVARSAAELKGQGRERLLTVEEIRGGLALETPARKAAFDAYQRWNRKIVAFAVAKGLIGADQVATWQRQDYIPFYRIGQTGAARRRGGIEGRTRVTQRLTGGTSELGDILNNMVRNASTLITEAIRNEVRAKVAAAAQGMPGGGKWIEQIPTETKATKVTKDQVIAHIEAAVGIEQGVVSAAFNAYTAHGPTTTIAQARAELDALNQTARQGKPPLQASDEELRIALSMVDYMHNLPPAVRFWLFGQDPTVRAGDQVMAVYRAGRPTFYEVTDPLLWRAITALNPKTRGAVRQLIAASRSFGQKTITMTPEFWLTNIWRDTWHGFVLSKAGFRPVIDSLRGMASRLRTDQDYRDFIANGGGMSSILIDEDAMRRRLERFYVRKGINPRYVLHAWDRFMGGIELIADSFELSTRLGEYKRAIARGEHPRRAAYLGREVSTDFALRGDNEFAGWAFDSVMFLKAAMNGIDRTYRGFTKDIDRGAVAIKAAMIAVVSAALAAYNWDDERYRRLEDWDRDAHWHIFLGDLHLRMPKIWEVGAMASSLERVTIHLLDERAENTESAADLGKHLWRIWRDQMKLDWLPYMVEPVYEVYALNRNRFTDRQIETQGMQTRVPSMRYSPYTSRAMVALGEATLELPPELQISPAKAEALVRGYFNTVGIWALQALDEVVAGNDLPKRKAGDLPVLRRFVGRDPGRTQAEKDFYDYLEAAREVHASINYAVKSNRPRAYGTLLRERGQDEHRFLSDIYEEVKDLNERQAAIYTASGMTPEAKREALDAIQRAKNEIFVGTTRTIRQSRRAAAEREREMEDRRRSRPRGAVGGRPARAGAGG